ncbi:MAG TPA: polysaccharide deacetylase family protein [Candidatus Limnocylindrales bacterium]|nr:polysaccharide deacetylase family protein [Candidatus Limnocylindrales bacterium]
MPNPTRTPVPEPTFVTHTVAAGETLTSIARRYGTSWQSLIFWNRAAYPSLDPAAPAYDPNAIRAGWRLQLLPGVVLDYEPVPGGATPTPTREPATPTPAPGEASRVISHGSRARNLVALTFDMGGRVDPAVDIVQWLVDHEVPASIFLTGAIVESKNTDAGRRVLAVVDENSGLLRLAHHSYTHADFRTLTASQMTDEMRRTEAAFAAHSSLSAKPIFRPPYGGYDAETLATVGALGYSRTVLWDVDTIDWKPTSDGGPTADDIVAKVVSQAQGGSIVLLHLGGYHTLEALPRIVSELRARGYSLVTLDDMLGL